MNKKTNFSLGALSVFISMLFQFTGIISAQNNEYSAASIFEVKEISCDVYAVIRKDPPGLMCDGNSGFIICGNFVVVVDAPEASAEIVKAIKKITDKPVKYVINTHWHDDHITGNKIYKENYPGVEFIAHTSTRDYLPGQGLNNRKSMIESAPAGVAYLKSLLDSGKSPNGSDITEEERSAFTSDLALVEHYLEFVPGVEIILPTITFENKLTINSPERKIEILKLGNGHTAGDIIVYLPGEKILFGGDLIVYPIPLVGSGQSHVTGWSEALKNILSLNPKVIVPGHGPVLTEYSYIDNLIVLFDTITARVRSAVDAGKSLDETRELVNLDEQRKLFCGDSKLKNFLFSIYVEGPAVEAVYEKLKK